MAHIFVYLERGIRGIHPASAIGICLARDLASTRGAGVIAVCEGDGGEFDQSLPRQAGRCGADQLFFVGAGGLAELASEFRPLHVVGAATHSSLQRLTSISGAGDPTHVWVDEPPVRHDKMAALVAVHAGLLPWHDFPIDLEPEYRADVNSARLPEWVHEPRNAPTNQRWFVRSRHLDDKAEAELSAMGAQEITAEQVPELSDGTLLFIGGDPASEIPQEFGHRKPSVDLVLLPGAGARPSRAWGVASYVIRGRPPAVLRELTSRAWMDALG